MDEAMLGDSFKRDFFPYTIPSIFQIIKVVLEILCKGRTFISLRIADNSMFIFY